LALAFGFSYRNINVYSIRWHIFAGVTIAFYAFTLLLYRHKFKWHDLSLTEKLPAQVAMTILFIPFGFLFTWDNSFDVMVRPLAFALAICIPAVAGPTPRLIGSLLIILGSVQLLESQLYRLVIGYPINVVVGIWNLGIDRALETKFWIDDVRVFMIEDSGATSVAEWLFWLIIEAVRAAVTIVVGFAIALCRRYGRLLGIGWCVINIFLLWFSSPYFLRNFVLDPFFYSMQPYHLFHRTYWILSYLLAGLYLALARRDDLVWLQRTMKVADTGHSTQPVHSTIPETAGWQQALRASLNQTGVNRPERGVANPLLTALGIGCLSGIYAALGSISLFQPELELKTLRIPALIALSFCLVGRIEARLLRLLRQKRARNAQQELERDQSRRPVLYLRSFKLEKWDSPSVQEFLFGPRPTPEERLVALVRRYGPVIAIGNPDEELLRLGAARLYVSNDLWQQKIADIASVSQLVFCVTGVSEGLGWEVSHLVTSVPFSRLILWAHPHLMGLRAAEREREWYNFLKTFSHIFPRPLPEKLRSVRYIYFTDSGEPLPITPRYRLLDFLLLRSPQVVALRAMLKAKGLEADQKARDAAAEAEYRRKAQETAAQLEAERKVRESAEAKRQRRAREVAGQAEIRQLPKVRWRQEATAKGGAEQEAICVSAELQTTTERSSLGQLAPRQTKERERAPTWLETISSRTAFRVIAVLLILNLPFSYLIWSWIIGPGVKISPYHINPLSDLKYMFFFGSALNCAVGAVCLLLWNQARMQMFLICTLGAVFYCLVAGFGIFLVNLPPDEVQGHAVGSLFLSSAPYAIVVYMLACTNVYLWPKGHSG
jgi:hypothetical protein